MTFTVRDWLTRSLRLASILAAGEPITTDQADTALTVASELLDTWRTERLTIYGQGTVTGALVAGQQNYSIGAGQAWDADAPLWIDNATYVLASGLEGAIRVYTPDQWASIPLKSLQSNIPAGIFYNRTYPTGTVSVYPVPTDATVQVRLYLPIASVTSVTDLTQTLSVPPGWAKALRYALAKDLAAEWDIPFPPEKIAIAIAAVGNIKRLNDPIEELQLDGAIVGHPRRRWSIKAGNFVGF